jgi:conflict system STAND superfamily ATPase
MTEPTVGVTVSGGHVQGIAGAGSVVIENFTIYNRAAEEPAATAADTEPIAPCPYPGLAYFGPDDADRFFGRDAAITKRVSHVQHQTGCANVEFISRPQGRRRPWRTRNSEPGCRSSKDSS